ncbi:LytR/AlgR family response regulator transcription factor [Joostella sp.]|uniref:LytR/AlgR family response regulator transcription factor n=1 Tax=Joostella sp. TaxID=2231138 RepID=UPI003A949C7A
MYRCLIIDDEELARALIKSYIDKLDFLKLVASFESPLDAMQILKEEAVDLIFLDIQMPNIKGTDFAKLIPKNTKVIFTTAYSEYALEGFELDALDYLLKPISFERFLKAVNKLQEQNTTHPLANDENKTITVKSGYDLYKLKVDDILYIESDSEYVNFYTADKKIMSLQSLKSLEKILNPSVFIRVHRSYLINKNKVTGLKGRFLVISEANIPISDFKFNSVKNQLFP